jgi:hypothetical protein
MAKYVFFPLSACNTFAVTENWGHGEFWKDEESGYLLVFWLQFKKHMSLKELDVRCRLIRRPIHMALEKS